MTNATATVESYPATACAQAHAGELGPCELWPTNDRPLRFTGRAIGGGTHEVPDRQTGGARRVTVTIYVTGAGRLVIEVEREKVAQPGVPGELQRRTVTVCETVDAALDALRSGKRRELGPASLDAWDEACEVVPELAPHGVRHVE